MDVWSAGATAPRSNNDAGDQTGKTRDDGTATSGTGATGRSGAETAPRNGTGTRIGPGMGTGVETPSATGTGTRIRSGIGTGMGTSPGGGTGTRAASEAESQAGTKNRPGIGGAPRALHLDGNNSTTAVRIDRSTNLLPKCRTGGLERVLRSKADVLSSSGPVCGSGSAFALMKENSSGIVEEREGGKQGRPSSDAVVDGHVEGKTRSGGITVSGWPQRSQSAGRASATMSSRALLPKSKSGGMVGGTEGLSKTRADISRRFEELETQWQMFQRRLASREAEREASQLKSTQLLQQLQNRMETASIGGFSPKRDFLTRKRDEKYHRSEDVDEDADMKELSTITRQASPATARHGEGAEEKSGCDSWLLDSHQAAVDARIGRAPLVCVANEGAGIMELDGSWNNENLPGTPRKSCDTDPDPAVRGQWTDDCASFNRESLLVATAKVEKLVIAKPQLQPEQRGSVLHPANRVVQEEDVQVRERKKTPSKEFQRVGQFAVEEATKQVKKVSII
ncbi:hypothetical protein CBR_g19514 [Chara braunii]|uniref:Uncharacterized protein n=1 Tax=Chara braunii TaxID=69332 RepID=A0A388KY61_CHABU|nr:hypothetical protein CBR_g19514 [Chara braunii]|eukprot:GBG75000.1 hypothetical protein CBR_g19514 [Chara braunii]